MKNLTVFESAVVGFFVGIVVSAYETFLYSTGGYISPILSLVSLRPVVDSLQVHENDALIASFVFVVAVFCIYGAVVGIIMKKKPKAALVVIIIGALIAAVCAYSQWKGSDKVISSMPVRSDLASFIVPVPRQPAKSPVGEPQQYYGSMEARGDLDGDGTDDVAFIISRIDPDRGTLYYLSAALGTTTGHTGLGLAFLGDKAVPQEVAIDNGIIRVRLNGKPRAYFAKAHDGQLTYLTTIGLASTTTMPAIFHGEASSPNGKSFVFKPCDGSAMMDLTTDSEALLSQFKALSKMSTTGTFGAYLIGSTAGRSFKSVASSTDAAAHAIFVASDAIDLVSNAACR